MAKAQSWTCDCGKVVINFNLSSAARVVCYCRDCRAFARYLDHANILTPAGGTEVVQTLPERFDFVSGKEHLACLNITGRDRLRWFARCCNTPIATTLSSRFIPYISVIAAGFPDATTIGPILAHAHRKHATPRIKGDMGNMNRVMTGMALRAAASFVTLGPWKSPFRAPDGTPVTEVQHMSDDERAHIYDQPAQS
ncbi:DUF6151 family protein [Boseongicola aestuarii]|uniref:CENP-V/GFA domain-containing protein n=1 Tax=Boseongicola aestuarii TaxID=1470561 RepID=A0A238J2F0_9RHOB|nr:DUF6151 family protein [Boseongicola aestuarii]SMX24846.1 hypothetical protein BOA8489_02977 [Boseongicola aestuarii]